MLSSACDKRVEAGRERQAARGADGERGIDQRALGIERAIGERIFVAALLVPDRRPGRHLAAGARRRRHGDDRREGGAVERRAALQRCGERAKNRPVPAATTLAASMIEPPPSATMTSGFARRAAEQRAGSREVARRRDWSTMLSMVTTGAPASAAIAAARRVEDRQVVGDERPAALADQGRQPRDGARRRTRSGPDCYRPTCVPPVPLKGDPRLRPLRADRPFTARSGAVFTLAATHFCDKLIFSAQSIGWTMQSYPAQIVSRGGKRGRFRRRRLRPQCQPADADGADQGAGDGVRRRAVLPAATGAAS